METMHLDKSGAAVTLAAAMAAAQFKIPKNIGTNTKGSHQTSTFLQFLCLPWLKMLLDRVLTSHMQLSNLTRFLLICAVVSSIPLLQVLKKWMFRSLFHLGHHG
jgi:hypothetical protein